MGVRSRVARPAGRFSVASDDGEPSEAEGAREFRVMNLQPPDGLRDGGAGPGSSVPLTVRTLGSAWRLGQVAGNAARGRGAFRRESGHAIGCGPGGPTEQRDKQQPAEHGQLCRVAIGWVNHLYGERHANSAGASLPR